MFTPTDSNPVASDGGEVVCIPDFQSITQSTRDAGKDHVTGTQLCDQRGCTRRGCDLAEPANVCRDVSPVAEFRQTRHNLAAFEFSGNQDQSCQLEASQFLLESSRGRFVVLV